MKSRWRKLESQEVYSTRYFRMRVDRCELPDGRIMPKYFVVDFPDWVQVVALTTDGKLLVVHQYRYPGEGWFLEFPGGSTDPNRREKPLAAAKRELREETGYTSKKWKYLGFHHPNPALLSNRCHVFLAIGCTKVGDLELDPFEDLEVLEVEPRQFVRRLTRSKKIHSLMLATYALARGHLEE